MKSRAIATLLLMASLATGAHATSLRGTVRDAETLTPIEGAQLTLQILNPDSISVHIVSGSDGGYEATAITPGNEIYVLYAYASGYSPFYARIEGLDGNDLTFDVYLQREPVPNPSDPPPDSSLFSGTVLGSTGTLVPVAGASVVLSSGGPQVELQTDLNGRYSIRLPLGSYSLEITASGFQALHLSGIALEAGGVVVNGVLRQSPTPVHSTSWGALKATYR